MSTPQDVMPSVADAERPDPFALLHGHIDEVIRIFRQLEREEPWSTLPAARLVDALPEILPKLLRLARRGDQHIDTELYEVIADQHGYGRRNDGVPLGALADEWNHVRRACWKVLQQCSDDERILMHAMTRLDPLFDDAIGVSLRGYYSPELDLLRGRGLDRRHGATVDRREGPANRRDG